MRNAISVIVAAIGGAAVVINADAGRHWLVVIGVISIGLIATGVALRK